MDNFDRLCNRIAQMLAFGMTINEIFWYLFDDLEPNEAGGEYFKFLMLSAEMVLSWGDFPMPASTDQVCTVTTKSPHKFTTGEDPPGSWHQQANGGRKLWTEVSGEFNTR